MQNIRYEVRLRAGVYRDHYEVDDFVKDFDTLEEALEFDKTIRHVISKLPWDEQGAWLEKEYDDWFAAIGYPSTFDYQGIWKITEELVDTTKEL